LQIGQVGHQSVFSGDSHRRFVEWNIFHSTKR
jgi:hypothetical protein